MVDPKTAKYSHQERCHYTSLLNSRRWKVHWSNSMQNECISYMLPKNTQIKPVPNYYATQDKILIN